MVPPVLPFLMFQKTEKLYNPRNKVGEFLQDRRKWSYYGEKTFMLMTKTSSVCFVYLLVLADNLSGYRLFCFTDKYKTEGNHYDGFMERCISGF